MKITPNAETSARTGIPHYDVREEDRHVSWTISAKTLSDMREWDRLSSQEQKVRLRAKEDGVGDEGAKMLGFLPEYSPADLSWYELHAIVARNSLRHFLGLETAPLPPA